MSRPRPAMDALHAALRAYTPRSRQEALDVKRIQDALRHADPWSRASPLHVTGSALVVDPASRRVLLRWHERLACWAQVGGHADPGETDPWEVALREAREETGLKDLLAWPPGSGRTPLQIVIVPVAAHGDEPAHEHADVRYLFSTARPHLTAPESPAAALRWLPPEHAAKRITQDNLLDLVQRAGMLLS